MKMMNDKKQSVKTADASGRGTDITFKVSTPGRLHPYSEDSINAVHHVMADIEGQTQGAYMRKFEKVFKEYSGAKHAFAVDNCTNALHLAAALCRLEAGDEVIIPAYTFCATAIPFGKVGAKIIWSDIDKDTWVVDPKDIERKITPKTKAIVVVHLLGMPVDMPSVLAIAEKYKLKVVEDCAQSPGSTIDGKHVGTFGDYGCFSWHGAKNFTTLGEGGFITVRDDADAALVPGLRHNGTRGFEGERERYWVPAMSNVDMDMDGIWPNNFCIGEAQCAVGIEELKYLDDVNDTLIAQAKKIRRIMADTPEITFAKVPDGYKHLNHQFIMHFEGTGNGKTRDDLLDLMVNEYKTKCIVQYYPLYRYPLFQKLGAGDQDCPVLEEWWDNSFSFPWWAGMDDESIDYLTSSLKSAIKKLKKGN
ncbi:MAG: DegT/DnrJ/EryC1/StrS family aminotransferase [Spirochaetaceae bacterium]|nr:DegT/DnrJ/EryC1/StrS family aminotransferase [Spirochaetaceae bacterium]